MSKYTDENGECLVCGFVGVDIHHIKSKGAAGKAIDEPWNLVSLCHPHHQELHKIGNKQFSEIHISYKWFLIQNNWEQCPMTEKWFYPVDR